MDDETFYQQLFEPLEELIGPIDPLTLVAIVGFDGGGPLNFSTIGVDRGEPYVTYVSCELAVRGEQQPSECGRYELLATADDEDWVRAVISEIGRMSLEVRFGDGDTLDIGAWVEADDPIQGVVLEELLRTSIDGESYGILRCVGVHRSELELAVTQGAETLVARLEAAGVFPRTIANRSAVC